MASTPDRRSPEERAAVHAALADPHRVAICDLLALSDRTPSDLGERLGMRSNLLAHHLAVLVSAGVTETVVSSGDRRRRYVRLRHESFEGLISVEPLRPTAVVFVCKQNSARSQLAAALWRERSSVPATSAGTEPARAVHPQAVRVAARHGLDLSGARPRPIADLDVGASLVVTVCDEANEALDDLGGARLHWSVADPVPLGRARAFEDAYEVLSERVALLCAAAA